MCFSEALLEERLAGFVNILKQLFHIIQGEHKACNICFCAKQADIDENVTEMPIVVIDTLVQY